jgi:hypothetical protein
MEGFVHFLVVDNRYGAPIFVFLECDPIEFDDSLGVRGRWVTLEPATSLEIGGESRRSVLGSGAAVGGDPNSPDRFAIFASEGQVRDAGFSLIEPRYIGPSWETYLRIFHPEGGKEKRSPANYSRTRTVR